MHRFEIYFIRQNFREFLISRTLSILGFLISRINNITSS